MSDEPRFLGIRRAAIHADLSEQTLRRLIRDGKLTRHQVGTKILIEVAELDAMIEGDLYALKDAAGSK